MAKFSDLVIDGGYWDNVITIIDLSGAEPDYKRR
jgi:hypothetical protein